MPKFTYPVIFVHNEKVDAYNALVPDLGLFAIGDTMEDAYSAAEDMLQRYFKIALQEGFDYRTPTSLEDVSKKWKQYKVSLLTAILPDKP